MKSGKCVKYNHLVSVRFSFISIASIHNKRISRHFTRWDLRPYTTTSNRRWCLYITCGFTPAFTDLLNHHGAPLCQLLKIIMVIHYCLFQTQWMSKKLWQRSTRKCCKGVYSPEHQIPEVNVSQLVLTSPHEEAASVIRTRLLWLLSLLGWDTLTDLILPLRLRKMRL